MGDIQRYFECIFPLLETLDSQATKEFEMIDVKDKNIFIFNQILYRYLWEIKEAIEVGFHQFILREIKERGDAIDYHDNNNSCSNCKICKNRKKVRDFIERKRPRICK